MLFRKVVLQSISAEHICRMLDTSHFSMYNFHARRFLFSQDSTFCTLSQIWTPFADYLVAIVFLVFGAIGCLVGQCLVIWVCVAIKVFIIHILIFPEKTLCHGAFIRQVRCDSIIQKQLFLSQMFRIQHRLLERCAT